MPPQQTSIADAVKHHMGERGVLVGVVGKSTPPRRSTKGNLGFWITLRDESSPAGLEVGYWHPDAETIWASLAGENVVVSVRGELQAGKNGSPVLFADQITPSDLPPEMFMPQPTLSIEESWGVIQESLSAVRGVLYPLTEWLLQTQGDAFRRWAAAERYHEPTIGGLAEHTARMLRRAENDISEYGTPEPYPSRLRAGVIWHDVGKLWTYGPPPANERLPLERIMGHSLVACTEVMRGCSILGLDHWDPDVKALVHMIASHHGLPEWGALVEPRTPEAKALHVLDLLESRRAHSELTRLSGIPVDDEMTV